MTGWEVLKLIKEGKAIKIKRNGDEAVGFLAVDNSKVIKWYPIVINVSYLKKLEELRVADSDFPAYCMENLLRELLAFDDWEVLE